MENITFLIILITAIISIYAWSQPHILEKMIFNPYQIEHKKEYYRLITSGFIHSDWSHLLFNMLSFYFFGRIVEYYFSDIFGPLYGDILYVLLYLLGIALSDVYALIAYKGSKAFNSLGASGGVSSVIYSSILFSPLDKIYMFFIPIGIPGFIYGILYLMYCSYAPTHFQKQVNHGAHLWGSVIGIVYTVIVYPAVVPGFIEQISQWTLFSR